MVDGHFGQREQCDRGLADRVGRRGGTGFQWEAGGTARSGPAQIRRAVGRVPQGSPPRAARAPMPLCARIHGAKDSGCEVGGWGQ